MEDLFLRVYPDDPSDNSDIKHADESLAVPIASSAMKMMVVDDRIRQDTAKLKMDAMTPAPQLLRFFRFPHLITRSENNVVRRSQIMNR